MKNKKITAVIFAVLAAAFYALNTPFSKLLLEKIEPTFMAAFLYIGAGIGVGIMYLFHYKNEDKTEQLTKADLPYTIGMILLDIAAPIFLMIGISMGSASNASLLGNFEIVATTVIALLIFKEKVSAKLWTAIGFITLSSILLSFEGIGSFHFSIGSLFVILATCCWGFENNCTRKISDKSTHQIVLLKGIFSGSGSFIIALVLNEKMPSVIYILATMLLGFTAYGLSIFLYIKAQRDLGAAKTSAYYAASPFIGVFLAFAVNGEKLTSMYFAALSFMIAGTVFIIYDTLMKEHSHCHVHTITHTHEITHEHTHKHLTNERNHKHSHNDFLHSKEHLSAHA